MTILFFTATGNSLSIAKLLGGELKSIPQLERANEYVIEDDVIGIVSPVYSLNLPLIVNRYLSRATLKAEYVFSVLTYGRIAGAANKVLLKVLNTNGNKLDYAANVLMVDNYLPLFKMENEIANIPKKNIDTRLEEIKQDIENRKHEVPHGDVISRVATNVMSHKVESKTGIRKINKTDLKFTVTEKCNHCGTCARVCPVSNITIEFKPVFHHYCESCFACIHNCPTGAIQLENQKSRARFRNSNVTLKEIIKANENEKSAKYSTGLAF